MSKVTKTPSCDESSCPDGDLPAKKCDLMANLWQKWWFPWDFKGLRGVSWRFSERNSPKSSEFLVSHQWLGWFGVPPWLCWKLRMLKPKRKTTNYVLFMSFFAESSSCLEFTQKNKQKMIKSSKFRSATLKTPAVESCRSTKPNFLRLEHRVKSDIVHCAINLLGFKLSEIILKLSKTTIFLYQ